jgi:molybdopterin-binding protein
MPPIRPTTTIIAAASQSNLICIILRINFSSKEVPAATDRRGLPQTDARDRRVPACHQAAASADSSEHLADRDIMVVAAGSLHSHRRHAMKISARNVLKGKVKAVKLGTVNAEVVVQLPGKIELVSVITKESAQTLKLKKGSEVYAVVKASSVMIAVD